MNRPQTVLLVIFIAVPLTNFLLPPLLSDGSRFADDPATRVAAAGYAFSIWGVIFSGMLWFSAYLRLRNEPVSRELRRAMGALCVAGLASIAFVPISIYANQLISWLDILAHLIPLIFALRWLRRHVREQPASNLGRWSFYGPSMYLGWICAATVISTSLMASEVGIVLPNMVATVLAVAVIVLLAGIAAWLTTRRDPVYGGTVAWALIAVGIEQAAYPAIRFSAWACAALVVVVIAVHFFTRRGFYAVS